MCYKQEEGDFVCYGEEINRELVPGFRRFLMFCDIFANLFDGLSVFDIKKLCTMLSELLNTKECL